MTEDNLEIVLVDMEKDIIKLHEECKLVLADCINARQASVTDDDRKYWRRQGRKLDIVRRELNSCRVAL